MSSRPPPLSVLSAFGVVGHAVALGRRQSAWLVGNAVFKPLDSTERELEWQARVLTSISCDGFRVAHPLRAADGSLVVEGWGASKRVEGRHERGRWSEVIVTGERFHAALAGVPCPEFLAERTDPWSIGDRVAWGELPPGDFAGAKHLPRLVAALRPIEAVPQLIHGDLTGNVLFAGHLPPAVIDFSPYWRPAPFGPAIVVADALVWEGADERVLEAVEHIDGFDQLLLRALIYRAVTDRLVREHEPVRPDDADPFLPVVALACRLAGAS